MLYKIKQILHSGTCGEFGMEITDGFYLKRIGRVVEINPDTNMFRNQMGHLLKVCIYSQAM